MADSNDPQTALVPVQQPQSQNQNLTLFEGRGPDAIIKTATETARVLSDVIRQKKLYATIGKKDHVLVEGWTTLGALVNVFPVVRWTRRLDNGWEARVEAVRNNFVIGSAEAQCTTEEENWENREDFALRSMAQTRAVSKALRLPLGWIVTLAGFEATPFEELTAEMKRTPAQSKTKTQTKTKPKYESGNYRAGEPFEVIVVEKPIKKSGKKADGKKWERYGIRLTDWLTGDDIGWVGTFDSKLASIATTAHGKNEVVRVELQTNGNFTNLLSIEPTGQPVASENSEPETVTEIENESEVENEISA